MTFPIFLATLALTAIIAIAGLVRDYRIAKRKRLAWDRMIRDVNGPFKKLHWNDSDDRPQ